MTTMYILKSPKGRLIKESARPTKHEAWDNSSMFVEGVSVKSLMLSERRYRASVRALGYEVVKVELVETSP